MGVGAETGGRSTPSGRSCAFDGVVGGGEIGRLFGSLRITVGDEIDFRAAGLRQDLGETLEQFVVRDGLERPFVLHADNIGRVFSTSRLGEEFVQMRELASRVNCGACAAARASTAL